MGVVRILFDLVLSPLTKGIPDSEIILANTWATNLCFTWPNIHLGPRPVSGLYTARMSDATAGPSGG